MNIIDNTGIPADVPFSTIATNDGTARNCGFVSGGVLFIKVDGENARNAATQAAVGFAPSQMVNPRNIDLSVSLPE